MYHAADSSKDEYARRIAYLIDQEGRIAEAHPNVVAKRYAVEQLQRLVEAQ